MAVVEDGTYRLGAHTGELLVKTWRSGMGAKAGHDLTLVVTGWTGTAVVDTARPADSSVSVEIDASSFEVRHGAGGIKPLTDADRAEIKQILRDKLRVAEHPQITFRSTRVTGSPDAFHVEGELTLAGITQAVTVRAGFGQDGRVRGRASVVQSRWGVKPYSAFFGALRLKDEVDVEFDVALTPLP